MPGPKSNKCSFYRMRPNLKILWPSRRFVSQKQFHINLQNDNHRGKGIKSTIVSRREHKLLDTTNLYSWFALRFRKINVL